MIILANSVRTIFSMAFIISFLVGCAGAGIKSSDSTSAEGSTSTSTSATTTATEEAATTDASKAKPKDTGPKFGGLKKRKVPYRPTPNAVTNKAFADNLMAARTKEAERFLKQGGRCRYNYREWRACFIHRLCACV